MGRFKFVYSFRLVFVTKPLGLLIGPLGLRGSSELGCVSIPVAITGKLVKSARNEFGKSTRCGHFVCVRVCIIT